MAIRVAKTSLPQDVQDGAAALLKTMTENPLFCRFALRNSDVGETERTVWTRNAVAEATHDAMEKISWADRSLQVHLVLHVHPSEWIARHFPGVGRTTTKDAKANTIVAHNLICMRSASQQRGVAASIGKKEDCFLKWTGMKDNVEIFPEIHRDSSGKLLAC
jgi:hypothetical protein